MSRLPALAAVLAAGVAPAAEPTHPPTRPLPTPSKRPAADGPGYYVDAARGADANDGSVQKPWKTLARAVRKLTPGDTLYLRGGTFFESVSVNAAGTAEKPITIRSYPGELAVIDAGLREFQDDPARAWEPVPGGAEGEYRSTKAYPLGGNGGNFAGSMVPLHRYLNLFDLRSANDLWSPTVGKRNDDPAGIYCGPGTARDPETGRIHVRLAHTKLHGLGANAYRGETDPRKVPLVVAGHDAALRLEGARFVRVQDLVVRGGNRTAIEIAEDVESTDMDAEGVELDGLAIYATDYGLRTRRTRGLKVVDCAFRGHTAPWHSRAHHKYRAHAGYLVIGDGKGFEFARCDFTDHHDGVQLHHVEDVSLHHCRLDNFNDDGIEPGPRRATGKMLIYQNLMTRTLSPFTLHGRPGEKPVPVDADPGSGVYIFRNVLDLRAGTYRAIPATPDGTGAYLDSPTEGVAHDHGSPLWPNYIVYHNTFVLKEAERRGGYAFRWGNATRMTTRRVFNNAFVQVEGVSDLRVFPPTVDDFQADGNLHWGVKDGPGYGGDPFVKFRKSPVLEASKKVYPPGWFAADQFADPKFVAFEKGDFRLAKESPAVDAGVSVPAAWPDPLREKDAGKPDVGAYPLGVDRWRVGPAK